MRKILAAALCLLWPALAAAQALSEDTLKTRARAYKARQTFNLLGAPPCSAAYGTDPPPSTCQPWDTCFSYISDQVYHCKNGAWTVFGQGVATVSVQVPGEDQQVILNSNDTLGAAEGLTYNSTSEETKAKFLNGYYAGSVFATSGDGTKSSGYVGWDTSDWITNAAECFKEDSNDLYPSCVVYLPPGIYWASDTRPFQNFTAPSSNRIIGMKFVGAGSFNTIIRPNPSWSGDEFWFYDNCADPPNCFDHCNGDHTQQCRNDADCASYGGTCLTGATPTFLKPEFEGIGFEGGPVCTGADGGAHCVGGDPANLYPSIPDNVGGFRIVSSSLSGSIDRIYSFTDIQFGNMNTGVELWGSNTASEMNWFNSSFGKIRGRIYSILRNGQSVNHNFYGCHAETYFGDLVYVEGSPTIPSTSGGGIFWRGGNIAPSAPLTGSPTTMSYLFHGGPDTGTSVTGVAKFEGIMYEARGPYNGLIKTDEDTGVWNVTFDNVRTTAAYTTGDGDKETVSIGPATTVWYQNGTFRTQNTTEMCDNPRGWCSAAPTVECSVDGDCATGTCDKGEHLCGNLIKFYGDERNKQNGRFYFVDTLVQDKMETYIDWENPYYGVASCERCKAGSGSTVFRRSLEWSRNGRNPSTDDQGGMMMFRSAFNAAAELLPNPVTSLTTQAGQCFNEYGSVADPVITGGHCVGTPFSTCDSDSDCASEGGDCRCSADAQCPVTAPYCMNGDRLKTLPEGSHLYKIEGSFPANVGCTGTANTKRYCVGLADKSETFGCTDYRAQNVSNSLSIDMQGRALGAVTTLRLWAEGGTGSYSSCAGEPVEVEHR